MATPVVLSPNAANRIRSAVSAISMMSRPYGVVGSGGRAAGGPPLPFALRLGISPLDNQLHAYVNLVGAWVTWGSLDMEIDTGGGRNAGLYAAWGNDDELDLGPVTSAFGLVFYVISVLYQAQTVPGVQDRPLLNKLRWGLARGADIYLARAQIPAADVPTDPDDRAAGDITGTVLAFDLGGVRLAAGGSYQAWQARAGSVAVPYLQDVEVVVDVQYDLTTHTVQKKTASLLSVRGLEYASDWTAIQNGEAELYP